MNRAGILAAPIVVNRIPAALEGLQSLSWPERQAIRMVLSGSPLP